MDGFRLLFWLWIVEVRDRCEYMYPVTGGFASNPLSVSSPVWLALL